MDHPLRHAGSAELRKRVVQLFRNAFRVRKAGNIVFVCGGNKVSHMRSKFVKYCEANLTEFEIFLPEYAMNDYFGQIPDGQFDIADFEELVGELSHAIVLFPEAPGSFAETGYFSAIPSLAEKTILAIDTNRQKYDSFISMGPAKKIGSQSLFQPVIHTAYKRPKFDAIAERINRIKTYKTKKLLDLSSFSDLSKYELFCLIHKCFDILRLATIDDVIALLQGIFGPRFAKSDVKKLTSILLGAKYIAKIGDYGHYYTNRNKPALLETRIGFPQQESSIALELLNLITTGDPEFRDLIEAASDAA